MNGEYHRRVTFPIDPLLMLAEQIVRVLHRQAFVLRYSPIDWTTRHWCADYTDTIYTRTIPMFSAFDIRRAALNSIALN